MIFDCQVEPLTELDNLHKVKRQSILIEGPSGCGKSYLANQYANMLNISDIIVVQPKVADIREAIDSSTQLQTDVVLVIENLDLGVAAAAYTLLKTLEEPLPHVYIIITARNVKFIPDTIISRSAVVTANAPLLRDIDNYAKHKDEIKYEQIKDRLVWKCARSFADADKILQMTADQINYYESLAEICTFNDSVSNIIWTIGHYPNNEPCDLELAIRSIMELMHNSFVTRCGIECLRDLSSNRIAQHAVLARFIFNAKYCE